MAFHDVRLDDTVARGAVGGPRFNTSISLLASGKEKRNENWEDTRGLWDISYGIRSKALIDVVLAFFYARKGPANSFRFKDWSDYQIGNTSDDTTRQLIGTGDGVATQFQIFKRYTSGAFSHDRVIEKIVAGTLRVWVNDVEVFSPATWSVDLLTGIITFVSPVTDTHEIEVITEFDVPVRFDADEFAINTLIYNAGSIPALNLVEVKGE